MKKVLFLAALLLVCFSGVTNAQTRKQREDAKREAWKKERQIGRAHVCTPVTSRSRMPSSA